MTSTKDQIPQLLRDAHLAFWRAPLRVKLLVLLGSPLVFAYAFSGAIATTAGRIEKIFDALIDRYSAWVWK